MRLCHRNFFFCVSLPPITKSEFILSSERVKPPTTPTHSDDRSFCNEGVVINFIVNDSASVTLFKQLCEQHRKLCAGRELFHRVASNRNRVTKANTNFEIYEKSIYQNCSLIASVASLKLYCI